MQKKITLTITLVNTQFNNNVTNHKPINVEVYKLIIHFYNSINKFFCKEFISQFKSLFFIIYIDSLIYVFIFIYQNNFLCGNDIYHCIKISHKI